jgi:hypothetical protein
VSSAYESATLIIRLYELRREPTMREARNWYARSFNPATIEEMMHGATGPNSAFFRMVTSYWDMACAFVLHDAIDEGLFNDANGEQHIIFAKIEPFIAEYRVKQGNPAYLASLEKLVMKTPGATERMEALRVRFRALAAASTASGRPIPQIPPR